MGEKLGQNFLNNKAIVAKIIQSADLQPDDLVLEIGPGKGILTEELAKKAGKVVATEIDRSLVEILQKKFADNKKVEIVEGDILEILNSKFEILNEIKINKLKNLELNENLKLKIENCNYKVVANIPYYITAPIIRRFLESDCPPTELILMVQKEVAKRICSGVGKMSILAVAVQYYAEPEILFNVHRGNFDPAPEVDSAVIRIAPSTKHRTPTIEETKHFFRVVRAGFSAKRKILVNNLANSFHLDKKKVEEKIISAGLKPNMRAQELSVEDWKKLANLFIS